MKLSAKLQVISALLVPLLFAGCGYHFSGGGQLPQNAKTICVQVFENKSGESGLDHAIANEIIYYFTRFKNVKLVDKEEAQAVLSGIIVSATESSIAHKTSYVTTGRRIKVVVDVRLTAAGGAVLWKSGFLAEDEAFDIDPDNLQTEENKKSALAIVSKRLAERIYYLMTSNF